MDAKGTAMKRWKWLFCVLFLLSTTAGYAHVGSPDIYAEGQAGPYRMSVVLRPPLVIPGVAEIEVRTETPGVDNITIAPVPLTGEAAKHPPVPDTMEKPSKDVQFFTGHLWIMSTGSWQVRFVVNGNQGAGTLSIPLPAAALATQTMHGSLGTLLGFLGIILLLGMVGIVGAAANKAMLKPERLSSEAEIRRGRFAQMAAFIVLVAAVVLGNRWWKAEAAGYAGNIYKPLQMTSTLQQGNVLDLKLQDPGWLPQRNMDDFIPDHDHLMHLYAIRWPDMDVVFHLHPQPTRSGEFQVTLPSMPPGDYRFFADVVHANGFPETMVSSSILPQINGRLLSGDDAKGAAMPIASGDAGPGQQSAVGASRPNSMTRAKEQRFKLSDGYTMIWKMPMALTPKTAENFLFELLDPDGKPPQDIALYMGMVGHAAFVKTDGTVFAHVHPNGTMAMAALIMANPHARMSGKSSSSVTDMDKMPGMDVGSAGLPNKVGFPYGFPSAGRYRIFVQMKHGSTIETGVFDADVDSSKP
jgi:hypothetical protein